MSFSEVNRVTLIWSATCVLATLFTCEASLFGQGFGKQAMQHFEKYCFDCHDDELKKGDLDLVALMEKEGANYIWAFENLITAKMPPKNKKQPSAEEKQVMLDWLARRQFENKPDSYRRISRHEFVHSANDLLGVKLDLTSQIPEDRGTNDFDSDRRIKLTKEILEPCSTSGPSFREINFPLIRLPTETTRYKTKV